ncbi:MAG: hypothetical protein ACXABY_18235 [Candidatus Thorarchaeota archaeon]|jgi:hypothetical protein
MTDSAVDIHKLIARLRIAIKDHVGFESTYVRTKVTKKELRELLDTVDHLVNELNRTSEPFECEMCGHSELTCAGCGAL